MQREILLAKLQVKSFGLDALCGHVGIVKH